MRRKSIHKQLILDAVKTLNIHATSCQVYDYVVKDNPSISKATIYRNLKQMAQDGDILDVGVIAGATHYDHNTHDHHHGVCQKCSAIFDVDCNLKILNTLKETAEPAAGCTIKGSTLVFEGLCSNCQ